ncbi:MAG: metallophosphoesterase [Nanopusillaceae archaeon]
MKILAISDIHNDQILIKKLIKFIKEENPNYLFILGDLADFGELRKGIVNVLTKYFDSNKIFFVPGNHETPDILEILEKKYNIKIFHKNFFEYQNFVISGIGGADIPFFEISEYEIEKFLNEIFEKFKNKKVILFSHLPPKGSKTSLNISGSEILHDFLKKSKISMAIHGHIHETGGLDEIINKSLVLNVARSIFLIEIDREKIEFKKLL